MKKPFLFLILWFSITGFYSYSQSFGSLEIDKIEVKGQDSIVTYRLNGIINDAQPALNEYHLFLMDRFGNYYHQKPAVSFMNDSVWNQYNVVIRNKDLNIRLLKIAKILIEDQKSINKSRKLTNSGLSEQQLHRFIDFQFLPNTFKIEF